jgi:hypothetical protein
VSDESNGRGEIQVRAMGIGKDQIRAMDKRRISELRI